MLNPSTADHLVDDPTIRRCVGFARRDGFSGISVVNLYAWRSPDPKTLRDAVDAVGPDNDSWLRFIFTTHRHVVAAWGATNPYPSRRHHWERCHEVMSLAANQLVDLQCFGTTSGGLPRHPLYLRADTPMEPYP
jgi:hypothetical protein